jgi:uncharacterized protein YutE (UPF0331/DUF86 family)
MNDTIINKVQSIQRCVARAREIYEKKRKNFLSDYDAQDAAVLNIMRACELSIDLANYTIKAKKLGIPTSSADSFDLLSRKQIIGQDVAEKMKNMVGFRNISVHEYQSINYQIVVSVIEKELDDLVRFTELIIAVE